MFPNKHNTYKIELLLSNFRTWFGICGLSRGYCQTVRTMASNRGLFVLLHDFHSRIGQSGMGIYHSHLPVVLFLSNNFIFIFQYNVKSQKHKNMFILLSPVCYDGNRDQWTVWCISLLSAKTQNPIHICSMYDRVSVGNSSSLQGMNTLSLFNSKMLGFQKVTQKKENLISIKMCVEHRDVFFYALVKHSYCFNVVGNLNLNCLDDLNLDL